MLVSPPATSVATAQAPQRQLYQVGPATDDDLIYATSIRVTQGRRNGYEVCPALSSDPQPPSCHQLAKTAPKTETARLNFGPGPSKGCRIADHVAACGPERQRPARTTSLWHPTSIVVVDRLDPAAVYGFHLPGQPDHWEDATPALHAHVHVHLEQQPLAGTDERLRLQVRNGPSNSRFSLSADPPSLAVVSLQATARLASCRRRFSSL